MKLREVTNHPKPSAPESAPQELSGEEVDRFWLGFPAMEAPGPDGWRLPDPVLAEAPLNPKAAASSPTVAPPPLQAEVWLARERGWLNDSYAVSRVFVLFNQALVPLGEGRIPSGLLQWEPELAGVWAWVDPSCLVFWLDETWHSAQLRVGDFRFQLNDDGSCQRL